MSDHRSRVFHDLGVAFAHPVAWVGLLLGLASATVGVRAPIPAVGIRPWHVLCVVGLLVAARIYLSSPHRRNLRVTPIDWVFAAFMLCALATEVRNSLSPGIELDIMGPVSWTYYLVGYFAVRLAIDSKLDARRFLVAFTSPAIPAAIVATTQLVSTGFTARVLEVAPSPSLLNRLDDERMLRATSLVGHWTGSGFYFCAMVAAACSAVLLTPRGRSVGVVVWASLIAGVFGAFTSVTLTVIATAIAVLIVTVLARGVNRRLLAGFIALVVSSILIFSNALISRLTQQTAQRDEYVPGWIPNTLAFRFRVWRDQTLPTISERPWTGWGSDVLSGSWRPYRLDWSSAESQYFGIALSYGWVVTAVLVALLLLVVVMLAQRTRSRTRAHRYRLPILALAISCIIASATVPAFTNRGLPVPFWILAGMLSALLYDSPFASRVTRPRWSNSASARALSEAKGLSENDG